MSVPICSETDSLAEVWQIFQQTGADQLVAVDERQVPLGILRLCRFVTVFSIGNSLPSVQSQLQQSSLMAHLALLDPVLVFWAEGSPSQLQPHLEDLSQQQIVLVNTKGECLGLLNRLKLLQHLATQPIAPRKSTTQRSPQTHQSFPDPLIELLERLPLPLMLQTSAGRVITQNLTWRQRVGEIQHPQRIRRAAARILESTLACATDAKPRQPAVDLPLAEVQSSPPTAILNRETGERTQLASGTAQATSVCYLGSEPNACVCVCPMKDGPDRVWQFIKVPMGAVPTPVAAWEVSQPTSQTALPFKLASLKFSPDPNWRSLMRTETLWLVLAQDMTEQQQVAKELAAKNADLIQLNHLKDEFLACISHELKTPLTAVLGMSSLLKDQLLGGLNPRQSHYAQLIHRSGRHLIAIVNNILDLTRIETGQLELLLEQIDIPTLCQQAYEQAQQQHLEAHPSGSSSEEPVEARLSFQLDIQPTLQHLVADELRLRQMLVNLLSNAIKFTEPGGQVGLRVESWEGWIAFTVWDTGIGIPADKQHLIFQKFQQLEHPLTRQFSGTGLGLVLTQRLARLHGGDISFTSTLGQGSQFTLLLPPVPPQASEVDFSLTATAPRPASSRNRPIHLALIVEAETNQLQQLEPLSELGYRTVIARSGTEAIEKARRLQPTVIFLNPRLPTLSGWDVLTLLKADETTRQIPIIVTAVRVEREQAYQNGADGFLSLPIKPEGLQRCLERLIRPLEPQPASASELTVLHLHEGNPILTLAFDQHRCRVLEVDDLDQADLLAKVWKPDVVLIDRVQTEPTAFVQQLSQATALAELPLITLTAEITQAANQIPTLSVFPYLAVIAAETTPLHPNIAELMQIMQLAVGVSWVPHVLIVDCAAIELSMGTDQPQPIRPPVQALSQYLQTAGFQSTISTDWQKVAQKLQHQSVDLLLLCVSLSESATIVTEMVQTLCGVNQAPPVLVWNYQTPAANSIVEATAQWQRVATRILPASLSILELLAQINQTLIDRRQVPDRS